ncbi:hypothetical protein B0T16DRAFT_396090 [Cercophora newfieldiana]|uniref:Uncharacterized protein n=1 Tax=Cercophora newfieldiana TaxID=92897 RepID=A0AA39YNV9_9PEZI|nr:hypothetical protein B0T16DRAFT_396090 [Cercophora newfieldiana]
MPTTLSSRTPENSRPTNQNNAPFICKYPIISPKSEHHPSLCPRMPQNRYHT